MNEAAQKLLSELGPLVMEKRRQNTVLGWLIDMDPELRRCAYQLAKHTLNSACGYSLMSRNMSSRPQDWSQEFRELVVHSASVLQDQEQAGKRIVKQITVQIQETTKPALHGTEAKQRERSQGRTP